MEKIALSTITVLLEGQSTLENLFSGALCRKNYNKPAEHLGVYCWVSPGRSIIFCTYF
jgi:hypothetical protein